MKIQKLFEHEQNCSCCDVQQKNCHKNVAFIWMILLFCFHVFLIQTENTIGFEPDVCLKFNVVKRILRNRFQNNIAMFSIFVCVIPFYIPTSNSIVHIPHPSIVLNNLQICEWDYIWNFRQRFTQLANNLVPCLPIFLHSFLP